MPSVAVLGPVVLPLIAAAVIAILGFTGIDLGRVAAGIGAFSSLAALTAVWVPVRSSVELTLGPLGFGSGFDMRIDGVTFAFGVMIAAPAAVLLSLQPRAWPQAVVSLLALAAALAAVESGGVVLTAIAGGTAATLAVVLLDTEDPRAPRPSWAMLLAGWLALSCGLRGPRLLHIPVEDLARRPLGAALVARRRHHHRDALSTRLLPARPRL